MLRLVNCYKNVISNLIWFSDIDECETGELTCREDEICQNSRGGAHCRSVACPPGYSKEPGSKQ